MHGTGDRLALNLTRLILGRFSEPLANVGGCTCVVERLGEASVALQFGYAGGYRRFTISIAETTPNVRVVGGRRTNEPTKPGGDAPAQ